MTDKPTVPPKGRFAMKYRGTECLNCGHPLDISDRYCPYCAQANSTKKLTLKDFFDEFFSNVINYDSRLLKTLSAMLLRPGVITKDYVEGKRMRYTNPFRFMLSLAIIYFLMLGFSANYSELDRYGNREDGEFVSPNSAFSFDFDENSPEQQEAQQVLDTLNIAREISRARSNTDSLILSGPGNYFQNIKAPGFMERMGDKHRFFYTLLSKDSIYSFSEATEKYGVPVTLENKVAFSMAGSNLKVVRRPGTFINSLISKLPFATFFFLPVFALFILLAYIRKKYTYTDNLIFSFHNQSLLFILLIVSFLVDSIFDISTAWVAITIFSIYLYKAMKNFYGQGMFKTIIKYVFLNTVFFILAGITGLIFILASAFIY